MILQKQYHRGFFDVAIWMQNYFDIIWEQNSIYTEKYLEICSELME